MPETFCGDCGAPMRYIENHRYNSFYAVKKDTWQCLWCRKTVESTRKVPGAEYK